MIYIHFPIQQFEDENNMYADHKRQTIQIDFASILIKPFIDTNNF